jgi:hypothetical protein
VPHVPTGCERTFTNEKDVYFFQGDVMNVKVWSHGPAKGFQLAPINFKTLAKCFSESGILFAENLKVHSSSPRSKFATSRSWTRSTLA